MRRWIIIIVAVIIGVPLLVTGIGLLLPVGHRASSRAVYDQPPDSLWRAITDVAGYPTWRDGVERVEVLDREPLRWREHTSFGPVAYRAEVVDAPRVFRARIDDVDQGFGGSWTWRIDSTTTGASVTITEDGEVYNPLFRFMSRFVFGHHGTQQQYLRDLGRRFGQEAAPERVE